MESLSGGKSYQVKITSFFKEINKLTGKMIIDGFVSHPFAKIKFFSYKPYANELTYTRTIRYKQL